MTNGVTTFAVISFSMGAAVFSFMLYTIILEERLQTTKDKIPMVGNNASSHHAFGLHLDKTSIGLIVSFVLLISLMKMIFSILLLIGIKKNKPSLVVAYFTFGSLLCLMLLVTTVLQLIHWFWYAAIITAAVALIMMERLSVVYSVYENMEKESDCDLLLVRDEFNDQESFENIISDI